MKEYLLRAQPTDTETAELREHFSSNVLATVFWYRNIKSVAELEEFSSHQNLLPTTELFDVVSFGNVLEEHREKGSKIVIYGDYDADGAISAAILWRFLSKELKLNATVYIPDRHEEGYGLNKQALLHLATQGVGLIITVDCGVRDRDLIEEVRKTTSMEIMVTDHHQPGDTFPNCVTVHPLFPGHESANRSISGGVVVWKLVRYLEDKMNLTHRFSDSVVDLAGTSLVTDIMPLVGENRKILKLALQKMRSSASLGIKVLAEIAQVPTAQLASYHLGYVIGPRLNASGRIGNQYTSTRLLSTDNEIRAREYAQETHDLNVKRQEITKKMFEEAEVAKRIIDEKLIIIAKENWDDGIIGLVAGKIMNTYNLPTIAISIDTEKKSAKGSARSFGDFDITAFFGSISEVFERFGGHQNAAGFTLKGVDINNFATVVANKLKKDFAGYKPVARTYVDSYVTSQDLNEVFFKNLAILEPFGQANFAPLFALRGKISQFSVFGQQGTHIRIEMSTDTGTMKGIAFDSLPLLNKIQQGNEVILVGKPKLDEYQGKKQLSFFIEDILTVLPSEN